MMHNVVFCFHTNDHEYNFGIGFLSAFLKKHGIDVDLVIYRELDGKQTDTPEGVARQILDKNPSVVAFSTMTFHWRPIQKVISLLRSEFNGLIIVGGYHALLEPQEVLSYPGVDAVCTGEGELPLLELITSYRTSSVRHRHPIEGLVFADRKGLPHRREDFWLVKDLEDYPYMDYDLFDSEGDRRLHEKHLGMLTPAGIFSLPVITGRGCPHRCTYCCNSVLIERYGGLRRYLRKYRPESAIAYIEEVVERYHPSFIEFFDETFTMSRTWLEDFCSRYGKAVGLPFSIMTRIDSLDESAVSLLAESGLKLVFFGLESGDEEYRERYLNRKMSNTTIREGARLLKKYGIMIVTFNMFGMPFETREAIDKTFSLNNDIEPEGAFGLIYQPLPGTSLAKMAYQHNMVSPPPEGRWDLYSPSLDSPELPASYVAEMSEKFRERFSNVHVVQNVYERLRRIVCDT